MDKTGQQMPDGWEQAYDASTGRYFYVDHNKKRTTWLNPCDRSKSPSQCHGDELPYGWERFDDPLVGTYYACHLTERNQWNHPVPERHRLSPHHYSNGHHQLSGNSLDSNNQTNSLTNTSKPDTSYVASDIGKSVTSLNNSTTLDTELVESLRSHNSTRGSKCDTSFLDIMDSCFQAESGESIEV